MWGISVRAPSGRNHGFGVTHPPPVIAPLAQLAGHARSTAPPPAGTVGLPQPTTCLPSDATNGGSAGCQAGRARLPLKLNDKRDRAAAHSLLPSHLPLSPWQPPCHTMV